MNAPPADQRVLLDIADLDRRLRAAEETKRQPPQAERISELAAQRQSLHHELVTRTGARDDLKAEIGRIDSDVSLVESRRERDEKRLTEAKNPKDAQGLEHELESLRKRLSDLEDAELEAMERLDQAEVAVDEQQTLVDETNAEGQRLTAEAKELVARADADIEALSRDRAALVSQLPEQLVADYERRAKRNAGAALFRGGMCEGCRMVLSGSDLSALRAVPEDEVATCPECESILVRTEESGL